MTGEPTTISLLDFTTTCIMCGNASTGRWHIEHPNSDSDVMRLLDSDGGLLMHNGWCCHNCLGEPWLNSDYTEETL